MANPKPLKSLLRKAGSRLTRRSTSESTPIVVYCSILGGYDDLPTFSYIDPEIVRVCFTDTPEVLTPSQGWKIVPIESAFVDAKLMNGYLKSNSHRLFGFDTTTVWVDGNLRDVRMTTTLVAEVLTHGPVATPAHLTRYAIKDEIAAVVNEGLESKASVARVHELLATDGFPPERSLSSTLVVVQDNSHEVVRAFNETWQQLICSGIRRDQLTFDYALWSHGLKAARIDVDWRAHNALFNRVPHRNESRRSVPDVTAEMTSATRLNMPEMPADYPSDVRWVFETQTEREGELHRRLNEVVSNLAPGGRVEGNYCHMDGAPLKRETPSDPRRSWKREYLRHAVRGAKHALEIGFNAGHSAVLMLEAEPKLDLVSVDIASHDYVRPCGDVMVAEYGKRFKLIAEDSRVAMKGIDLAKFDFVHIDGGHGEDIFTTELDWFCANSKPGTQVLVDDCYISYIRAALDRKVRLGLVHRAKTAVATSGENELFIRA